MLNRPEPIRQASLLMVLASGIGNSVALIDGLQSLANDSRSPWADRVNSLRLLLEQGLPLSAALAGIPGLLPDRTLNSIRVGQITGTLREVLFDEAARLTDPAGDGRAVGFEPANTLLWVSAVGLVAVGIVSFIMVFIVPKFKKIFADFNTELPRATELLIDISDRAVEYSLLLLPPVMIGVLGTAAVVLWAGYQKATRGRQILSHHWPRYWVPDVLRMLSLAVVSGNSFAAVLHAMLNEMQPGRAARVFSALRQQLDTGNDCTASMVQLGLLNYREAAFLNAAQVNGHLDWGFRHLAADIERRRFLWGKRLLNLFEPLLILLVGIGVLFVVLGLFLPVIKLSNDLA